MASQEQLAILKQGVEVWNKWREENPKAEIDLSQANLSRIKLITIFNKGRAEGVDLSEANLSRSDLDNAKLIGANLKNAAINNANLSDANLNSADLCGGDLRQAKLNRASLRKADLRKSNLIEANLSYADLKEAEIGEANLRHANLTGAHLNEANLCEADLRNANLKEADLREAYLLGSNFSNAWMDKTSFGNSDLSEVIGLEDINHWGPSSISTDTFALSKGKISEDFLRGCGLSDWEIELAKLYNPDLSNEEISKVLYMMYDVRASQAIQISPLFISYNHADGRFVEKLEDFFNDKGIRFWRDVHHATAGRLEKQIDWAIRQNPTVLLVLSSNSIRSDWVEHEVRTARELEKELGRDTLCPVALDDSWKSSPWPKRVMEQVMEYNILDFSAWQDDSKFEGMFRRLIDGLELFYKG